MYHFVSISYTCYIWYNYQWRVDEEMWTLCITLCHFASIPGGTPSHRYRYLHSTSTLVHQFSLQILQLFLVKYKRRCGWKRSMFQFHLSFSSMNTAIVINPCPMSVQQIFLVRNEKKKMLTEQKGLVTKPNSITVPHLRGFYIWLQKMPGLKFGIAPGAALNSLRLSFVKPLGT